MATMPLQLKKGVRIMLFSIVTRDENQNVENVDFTQYITVPSYKVNEFDDTEDWKDGNGKKHKNLIRTQIRGTFTLKFFNVTEFNRFFEILEANKIVSGENSCSVLATVYVQNKNIVKTTYVFVTADPADTLPLLGTGSYEGFEVSIEEV